MKIGFIGVGKLGKDVAEVMSQKHEVKGYDIVPVDTTIDMVQTIQEVCRNTEIIFIAVPTPHHELYDGRYPTSHLEPKDFDYSIVKNILVELNAFCNVNQLVVLISTVLPGTIRRDLIPLVQNYKFVYNPYLIAMGSVKEDFIDPDMVIIGTETGCESIDTALLINFYKSIISKKARYEVGTWDEAESIKVFYNTFLSTKVALVNMIQDVAEKNGNINVDVVTEALAKSNYRITSRAYMKPGMGDGGGCHPRDNIALRFLANKLDLGYDLFDSIMKAREVQAENIANKLINLSKQYNLPVVILGKSYKPDVSYIEGSSSILVGHYVEKELGEIEYDSEPKQAIFLLGHYGKHHDYNFPTGSVVLDPWRQFKSDKVKVIHYGNTRE